MQLVESIVYIFQISVIADDLGEIAKEVAEFSRKYNHVITSGGVGPTHDDMTFEGMGKCSRTLSEFLCHNVGLSFCLPVCLHVYI